MLPALLQIKAATKILMMGRATVLTLRELPWELAMLLECTQE